MKNFLVVLMLSFGLVAAVQAKDFKEGKEYLLVEQQRTQSGDKIEVLEFFWYGCPHCYSFEPHIQKWLSSKPDNVEFIRVPAIFRPSWKVHARTYYALEIMGITEKMHTKIFSAMHKAKKKLNTLNEMTVFMVKNKVDRNKFTEAYNSFAAENMMRKAIKALKNYKVQGVPGVAVNGKYFITGQTAGNSYDNLIDILNYLIKKETVKQK